LQEPADPERLLRRIHVKRNWRVDILQNDPGTTVSALNRLIDDAAQARPPANSRSLA
jgi:hypothetical protein